MDRTAKPEPLIAPTLIGRLLMEVSWGDATQFHNGGRGHENVLTAEVFQSLDFLPRVEFLGAVLNTTQGAAATVQALIREAAHAEITLLPGDIYLSRQSDLRVQPDAIIESASVYCLVETKRMRGGAFQTEQLAREYLAVLQEAERKGLAPLLLLVLGEAPPVRLRKGGRMDIATAISNCLHAVRARCEHTFAELESLNGDVGNVIGFTTWSAVEHAMRSALLEIDPADHMVNQVITRLAENALTALEWHRV